MFLLKNSIFLQYSTHLCTILLKNTKKKLKNKDQK